MDEILNSLKKAIEIENSVKNKMSSILAVLNLSVELLAVHLTPENINSDSEKNKIISFLPQRLKQPLEKEVRYLKSIEEIISNSNFNEEINECENKIAEYKEIYSKSEFEEIVLKLEEVEQLQIDYDKYQRAKLKLSDTNFDKLKEDTQKLVAENEELLKMIVENEKDIAEKKALTEKLSLAGQDCDSTSEKLYQVFDSIISEIDEKSLRKEKLLATKKNSLSEKISKFNITAENLENVENSLRLFSNDIGIVKFYPEFDKDIQKITELKNYVSEIEPKIKEAILAKEEFIKNIKV